MTTTEAMAIVQTLVNRKTGEEVTLKLSHWDALQKILKEDPDNWLLFWLHKMANELEQGMDVRKATKLIGNMFMYAAGRGLKKPKINLVRRDDEQARKYLFYLSRQGTLCMKRAYQSDDEGTSFGVSRYMGWISNGKVGWGREWRHDEFDEGTVERLFADPIKFIADSGRDVGSCCYCSIPLTDPRSMKAGYGETCAKNWGLPWGNREYPSFTELFTGSQELQGMMAAVCADRRDATGWAVVSDWLEERGIPAIPKSEGKRLKMPEDDVILPREC